MLNNGAQAPNQRAGGISGIFKEFYLLVVGGGIYLFSEILNSHVVKTLGTFVVRAHGGMAARYLYGVLRNILTSGMAFIGTDNAWIPRGARNFIGYFMDSVAEERAAEMGRNWAEKFLTAMIGLALILVFLIVKMIVVYMVSAFLNLLASCFSPIGGGLKRAGVALWNGFKNGITNLATNIKRFFRDLLNACWNGICSFFGGCARGLGRLGSACLGYCLNTLKGFWQSIFINPFRRQPAPRRQQEGAEQPAVEALPQVMPGSPRGAPSLDTVDADEDDTLPFAHLTGSREQEEEPSARDRLQREEEERVRLEREAEEWRRQRPTFLPSTSGTQSGVHTSVYGMYAATLGSQNGGAEGGSLTRRAPSYGASSGGSTDLK